MGPDSQPMVEVPHKHPPDNGEGNKSLEQAKEAISSVLLGRIGVANSSLSYAFSESTLIAIYPTLPFF